MPGFFESTFTFLDLTRTSFHFPDCFTSFRLINYLGDRADFISCAYYFNEIGHSLVFLPASRRLKVSVGPVSPYRGSKTGSSHLQSGQS